MTGYKKSMDTTISTAPVKPSAECNLCHTTTILLTTACMNTQQRREGKRMCCESKQDCSAPLLSDQSRISWKPCQAPLYET